MNERLLWRGEVALIVVAAGTAASTPDLSFHSRVFPLGRFGVDRCGRGRVVRQSGDDYIHAYGKTAQRVRLAVYGEPGCRCHFVFLRLMVGVNGYDHGSQTQGSDSIAHIDRRSGSWRSRWRFFSFGQRGRGSDEDEQEREYRQTEECSHVLGELTGLVNWLPFAAASLKCRTLSYILGSQMSREMLRS